jgi:3-hydroxyisobutyrate dehydrogenase
MAKIAFLGTGLLGAAFAEAAAVRGDTVTAWNRSPDKVQALTPFGVIAAATPEQAVRDCVRVHLVLKDDDVVEDVLAAARPGLARGAVIVDHTTTLPGRTAARAAQFAAQGIKYLHCPVFMGPPAARKALGSMMVSGPQAAFDEVKAELAKMTGRLEYYGERSDLSAVKKLCGNAAIIGVSALLADILTIAQASGVSGEEAISALGLFDINSTISGRGMNMAKGNFAPSFELTMARKDVRLMIETAGARPLAALPAIAARMDQLIAAGHGAQDASVLGIDAVQRG